MYYDEKDICEKCGDALKSHMIEYEYMHDMGLYEDEYKKVDRNYAKQVGLDFYCNDCYNKIGKGNVDGIISEAVEFLNKDLANAIIDVEEHYKQKMQKLMDIRKYINKCLSLLEEKAYLSELSKDEMEFLTKINHIYQPNYQTIEIGFCPFKQYSEVVEMYNQKG